MPPLVKLNSGTELPQIGFGTWEISPDSRAQTVVGQAIVAGYRLLDTAKLYGNEAGVGAAVTAANVPRSELVVTTKLWNDDQGYDRTMKAFDASLSHLGLDYIDLYLIHWPATSRRHESWRALEQIYKDGRAKAVGVCNYSKQHLDQLLERSSLVPAVNQVEFHPFIYEQQAPLLKFCAEQGIVMESYSPLKRLEDADTSAVLSIAHDLSVNPQQVVLRWCIQHGTVPLPRSQNQEHMASNLAVSDFELSPEQIQQLDAISDGRRVTWDPAEMPL